MLGSLVHGVRRHAPPPMATVRSKQRGNLGLAQVRARQVVSPTALAQAFRNKHHRLHAFSHCQPPCAWRGGTGCS
jgi:hypothetical protein